VIVLKLARSQNYIRILNEQSVVRLQCLLLLHTVNEKWIYMNYLLHVSRESKLSKDLFFNCGLVQEAMVTGWTWEFENVLIRFILSNYLENRKTWGESVLNIQSVSHISLKFLSEKLFCPINIMRYFQKRMQAFVKNHRYISDINENCLHRFSWDSLT
jgi:hypothetical protein